MFLLQSLRFLDWVTNRGFSILTVLYISYLTFAGIWVEVIPFALVIAIIFTWNNIINNQELIIIQATGVKPIKIYLSVITMGIFFCIATFFLTFYLVPSSYAKYSKLRANFPTNYNIKIFEAEKFVRVNENTNFYIKEIAGNHLTSIFIYYYNPANQKENFIYAEDGYVDIDGGKITMLLNVVNIQELSSNNSVAFLQLDKYIFDINTNQKITAYQKNSPREYTLRDFLNLKNVPFLAALKISSPANHARHIQAIRGEIIKRINVVMFPLLLSIVSAYFFSIRQYKRLGNIKPIFQTLVVGSLLKIISILVLSFDSYFILSLPIILSLILGIAMILRIIYPPSLKQISSYKIFT
jgi:lipopolysaccharide export LptBFGC system permease protein LptF